MGRFLLPERNGYKVRPELTALVAARQMNLAKRWQLLGTFDLVFLRNILIYFSPEVKKRVAEQLMEHLAPGSVVVMAAAESLPDIGRRFEKVAAAESHILRFVG
jgi:chemotaxis protein methyltransferase CheR